MAKKSRVLELRKRLKMSQADLAAALGVNQSTVCRIEAGQRPSGPIQKLLEHLAKTP